MKTQFAKLIFGGYVIISTIILLIIYAFPFLKLLFEIFQHSVISLSARYLFLYEIRVFTINYQIINNSFNKIKNNAKKKIESIKNTIKIDKAKAIILYLVKFLIFLLFIYFIYYLWKYLIMILLLSIKVIEFILFILTFIMSLIIFYIIIREQSMNFFHNLMDNLRASLIIFLIKNDKFLNECNKKKIISYCFIGSLAILLIFIIFRIIFNYIIANLYYISLKSVNVIFIILLHLAVLFHYLINFEKVNDCVMRYTRNKYKILKKALKEKLENSFDQHLINAKKLVNTFLSEEKSDKYNKFAKVVNKFRKNDFYKLLNGEINIENDDYEIDDLCFRYKIEDKENFKFLILKFLNFQIILSEWYEDKTKHEYLKGLWKIYPIMYKLHDLNEEDLEIKLREINYSKWNEKDKNTFKQCISNSPEIKAIQISNFIKNDINDFNLFLENMMNYKSCLNKYEKMENYGNKLYNYTKQFLKNFLKKKGKIEDSAGKIKDIINNRTIEYILKNYISKNSCKSYEYYFGKIINLMKNEKAMNILNFSEQILIAPISFLELSYHVIGLIQCFKELYHPASIIYEIKLQRIKNNFHIHKEKISDITGNDEEDFKLLKSILLEIKQDRDDIIKLIDEMKNKKNQAESNKDKYITKTIKNTIITIAFTAGTIFSGGISSIVAGVGIATGVFKTLKSGAKIIENIKLIDSFKELLNEAENKQKEIEEEIKNIENICYQKITEHCPEEMKQKILEKYCI